jgi:hypothetical protein
MRGYKTRWGKQSSKYSGFALYANSPICLEPQNIALIMLFKMKCINIRFSGCMILYYKILCKQSSFSLWILWASKIFYPFILFFTSHFGPFFYFKHWCNWSILIFVILMESLLLVSCQSVCYVMNVIIMLIFSIVQIDLTVITVFLEIGSAFIWRWVVGGQTPTM